MGYHLQGGIGLGGVAVGDFIGILIAQRNEAGREFGLTNFNQPGRTDTFYPQLTGTYTTRLIDYWRAEAQRILQKQSATDLVMKGIFGSRGQYDAWVRKVEALGSLSMIALRAKAITLGNNLIPQDDAKKVWVALDDVVLPMRGISETPSEWELMAEAVEESLPDVVKNLPKNLAALEDIAKLALYGSLVVGLWWFWKQSNKGGRR
jgi:hypothetical protein